MNWFNCNERGNLKTSSIKIQHCRPLTPSKNVSQTLGIFPIWKCGCTCGGSWLPSESGFCPEKVPTAIHRPPRLKEMKCLSLSGSFCFAGGVLGMRSFNKAPSWLALVLSLYNTQFTLALQEKDHCHVVWLWGAVHTGPKKWTLVCKWQASVGVDWEKLHMCANSQTPPTPWPSKYTSCTLRNFLWLCKFYWGHLG